MPRIKSRVKLLAAATGAGSVIAMSALTIAFGGFQAQAAGPVVAHDPTHTGAGNTVTIGVPPSDPPIANAAPGVQADPWQGKGWPADGWMGMGGHQ